MHAIATAPAGAAGVTPETASVPPGARGGRQHGGTAPLWMGSSNRLSGDKIGIRRVDNMVELVEDATAQTPLVEIDDLCVRFGRHTVLRGISLPMILFVVIYTALGSLGLSVIGLLAGTLTGEKHWQILLSVVLIVGLVVIFFTAIPITGELVFDSDIPFGTW